MLRKKLPIFPTKLQLKLLLLLTAKQILIVLLIANLLTSPIPCPAANFYYSAYIPNPNTCKATDNITIIYRFTDVRRIN